MGNRFNGVAIGAKGVGEQHFAVSGGTTPCNFKLASSILVSFVQGAQCFHGDINRFAFVGGIKRVDEFTSFVEQGELSGGGPAVHAKVYAECFRKVSLFKCGLCLGQLMAFVEDGTFCVGFEERLASIGALRRGAACRIVYDHDVSLFQRLDCLGRNEACLTAGEELFQGKRCAHCNDGFGVIGNDDVFPSQLKALGKNGNQARVEGEGPAFEYNRSLDFQALSQAADGLLGDSVKRR